MSEYLIGIGKTMSTNAIDMISIEKITGSILTKIPIKIPKQASNTILDIFFKAMFMFRIPYFWSILTCI
jgi:hypothetical protein